MATERPAIRLSKVNESKSLPCAGGGGGGGGLLVLTAVGLRPPTIEEPASGIVRTGDTPDHRGGTTLRASPAVHAEF